MKWKFVRSDDDVVTYHARCYDVARLRGFRAAVREFANKHPRPVSLDLVLDHLETVAPLEALEAEGWA